MTAWHAKTLDYFSSVSGLWAFVTTNSITQGEAVAPLFVPILGAGWRIKFAHRTFAWTSEAPGSAIVHCVIVGFAKSVNRPRLFDYPSLRSEPVEIPEVESITPYLTTGTTVIVHPSGNPLNRQLGVVAYGNKPTDDGYLIVEPDDYDEVMSDPIAAKYVRPYVGARELLHGGARHCLWLVEATSHDMKHSPVLRQRIAAVRAFRSDSKAASTRAASSIAHLFRQIAQPNTSYLCIPAHSLESRPYFLAARLDPNVITSNANFLAVDGDGFMFAVISSTMFMTWQLGVGGRIKSDPRFNKLLTWNTFPLPPVAAESRQRIIAAGANVVAARQQQPDVSLANLYAPGRMSGSLVDAHVALDNCVDDLFGVSPSMSTLERLECLFAHYIRLTSSLVVDLSSSRTRPR